MRFARTSRALLGLLLALLGGLVGACSSTSGGMRGPEAISLLGEPLERALPVPELQGQFQERYEEWRTHYEESADHEAIYVWLGRYLAYLGRFREAIGIYTEGLGKFPKSYKLLRHRGHRYISIRQFALAERDLLQASILMAEGPDQVEPDGIPNERNEPRSTYHGNVWYHLGLAFYLQGDFESALPCYLNCLELSRNDDMLCAATYWIVWTLRRLERFDDCAEYLEPIRFEMDVIENRIYHRLLLLARGDVEFQDLEQTLPDDPGAFATQGYGLAAWLWTEGEREEAVALLRRIVAGDAWSAFGHIAAEADLAAWIRDS